ncbi:M23/M56 family metallopeptidase [Aquimarina sp. SS2-1]|uniref:M23/M56 family metallopeptidase n=1 Tax=Aquimarina besae TaxID=3342247 RepID=UPI00366F7E5F
MIDLLTYILQVSICLAILYMSYYLLFRKLTFHKINRILLLFLLPLSLAFPFLNKIEVTFPVIPQTIITANFNEDLLTDEPTTEIIPQLKRHTQKALNTMYVLFFVYILGVSICILRLFLSFIKLYVIKRKSKTFFKDGYYYIISDIPNVFSCFRWIFIPKDKINHIDPAILEHEKVHVKFKHTIDLLLTELYSIFFWFNPFIYFFKKSLKSIHEFQADEFVLNSKIKKSHYLELLIKSLGAKTDEKLFSYFNHSLIKKRIDMITKTNSHQKKLFKYLLITPIIIVLITAFVTPEIDTTNIENSIIQEEINVELPPSIFPIQDGSKDDITAVFGKTVKHKLLKKDKTHGGIDIRAKIGTPVIATADGIIMIAKKEGNWGNLIVISHADGYESWYAHLDSFQVTENQQVKIGQVIGKSGNTGLSTGPHLHYEVRLNGKKVNPLNYIHK